MHQKVDIADIRVTHYMGLNHIIADVTEPSGQIHQWVLPIDLVPKDSRPDVGNIKFLSGDHVLYTEQMMPPVIKTPFYKLLDLKKKGEARKT